MASSASSTFTTNALNYQGVMWQLKPRKTPLTTMLMQDGKEINTGSKVINMSKTWAPDAFSQPAISEATAVAAPAETSWVNSSVFNVKQIFHEAVEVSYAKMADTIMTATAVADMPFENDGLAEQEMKALAQAKGDLEYSILNGSYQADGGSAATARKMRGIISAVSSNTVAAAAATLTKDMIRELLVAMAGNEAAFERLQIHCNAFQMDVIDQLYGAAPTDRFIGGTQTLRIMHPFAGEIELVFNPVVPAATLLVVDYNFLQTVWTPKDGQRVVIEDLAKTGASERRQVYFDAGIDYTNEVLHGTITNLATS